MSLSFLVDVNLPKYFNFFNSTNFIFVSDLNLKMTDTEIWNYALKNNLIILTKDVDFFNRFLVSEKSPKIVYFQLGNFSLKQLYRFFSVNWQIIQFEIENNRLLIVKDNHIESIP
ncbi:DUF5615 family PIN-like protein [Flavobacterium sp.]|uniref:DUF5615 family PIN-like protein n=1 Tax=Flavobacterium sp. TaxID=239 RepID=UPI0038D3CF41